MSLLSFLFVEPVSAQNTRVVLNLTDLCSLTIAKPHLYEAGKASSQPSYCDTGGDCFMQDALKGRWQFVLPAGCVPPAWPAWQEGFGFSSNDAFSRFLMNSRTSFGTSAGISSGISPGIFASIISPSTQNSEVPQVLASTSDQTNEEVSVIAPRDGAVETVQVDFQGEIGIMALASVSGVLGVGLELDVDSVSFHFPLGNDEASSGGLISLYPGLYSRFSHLAINPEGLDRAAMIFDGGLRFKIKLSIPSQKQENIYTVSLLNSFGVAGCFFYEQVSLAPCFTYKVGFAYGSDLVTFQFGIEQTYGYDQTRGLTSVYPLTVGTGIKLAFGR